MPTETAALLSTGVLAENNGLKSHGGTVVTALRCSSSSIWLITGVISGVGVETKENSR